MRARTTAVFVIGALAWLGGACGDDDQGPATLDIEKPTLQSGDQQTGPTGQALASPLRVLITRTGEPVAGVDVEWSVGQGGSLSEEQASDEEGIASVVWTLGPDVGEQEATAAVEGADGSPLTYTALATPGGPSARTIQVVNNEFVPSVITVEVGETVTWVWATESIGPHNVQPDDGVTPGRSGNVAFGPRQYSFTFNQIGDYRYYCQSHGSPNGVGMAGRVIVQPAGN
ncbi:MAG TPA: plastocyanin/azurin family copper-binding protein [Gemmatimonadales bacterium]|jgi:plastocyanin